MNDGSAGHQDHPVRYEIRLQGHLAPRWAAWFDGMTLTALGDGTTVLVGPVADQAALHGVLTKLRDLGLPLLALSRVDITPQAPPQPPPDTSSAASHSTVQGD